MKEKFFFPLVMLFPTLVSFAQCIDNPDVLLTQKNKYLYICIVNDTAYHKIRINDKIYYFTGFDTLIKNNTINCYEGTMMNLWVGQGDKYKLIYKKNTIII